MGKKGKIEKFRLKQADYWLIGILTTFLWYPSWNLFILPVNFMLIKLNEMFSVITPARYQGLKLVYHCLFIGLWPLIFLGIKAFFAKNKRIRNSGSLIQKLRSWKVVLASFLVFLMLGVGGYSFTYHVRSQYGDFLLNFLQSKVDNWQTMEAEYPALALWFKASGSNPFVPANNLIYNYIAFRRKFIFNNNALGGITLSLVSLGPAVLLLCGLIRRNIPGPEEIDKPLGEKYLSLPKNPRIIWDDPIAEKVRRSLRQNKTKSFANG